MLRRKLTESAQNLARHKSVNVVEQILEACPPLLMQQNKSGETALHTASRYGRDSIVKALIEAAKAHPRGPRDHGDLEKGAEQATIFKGRFKSADNIFESLSCSVPVTTPVVPGL